jgi:hypothetical protein
MDEAQRKADEVWARERISKMSYKTPSLNYYDGDGYCDYLDYLIEKYGEC